MTVRLDPYHFIPPPGDNTLLMEPANHSWATQWSPTVAVTSARADGKTAVEVSTATSADFDSAMTLGLTRREQGKEKSQRRFAKACASCTHRKVKCILDEGRACTQCIKDGILCNMPLERGDIKILKGNPKKERLIKKHKTRLKASEEKLESMTKELEAARLREQQLEDIIRKLRRQLEASKTTVGEDPLDVEYSMLAMPNNESAIIPIAFPSAEDSRHCLDSLSETTCLRTDFSFHYPYQQADVWSPDQARGGPHLWQACDDPSVMGAYPPMPVSRATDPTGKVVENLSSGWASEKQTSYTAPMFFSPAAVSAGMIS